jgi:glycosyltransferase involved in cell wall biosynthesis
MAWALPVIGTRVGGIPDLVDDQISGRLVESGNVSGLASAMKNMLDRRQDMVSMGTSGRKKILESFTMVQSVARHRQLYKSIKQ